MDELLKEMERFRDITSAFTLADVGIVLLLSYVLSSMIAWIYRYTHQGISYSQSYTQTLVLLGMVVAPIMLIIGSNLARAFSLVGALPIIRFRNAVKETRDVGFVFVVMAIGMACGSPRLPGPTRGCVRGSPGPASPLGCRGSTAAHATRRRTVVAVVASPDIN